ncbi:MAG: S16 family serine protease, partial [Akkermansiaceae bacterium]
MQSQVKGLLVVQLGGGEFAGTASQMNATVVPGKKGTFSIKFNQAVGSMMEKATVEVEKFMRVRHGDKLPVGHRIELAFSDKYSPKDGPSAAVVSALLTDSIITGEDIDPDFAATGDMTAAGEVRPVGGLSGKVSGAIKKDCKIIGIPAPNQNS